MMEVTSVEKAAVRKIQNLGDAFVEQCKEVVYGIERSMEQVVRDQRIKSIHLEFESRREGEVMYFAAIGYKPAAQSLLTVFVDMIDTVSCNKAPMRSVLYGALAAIQASDIVKFQISVDANGRTSIHW